MESNSLNKFPFESLPKDIQKVILWHLDVKTLLTCAQVCKLWYQFINDPKQWKILFDEEKDFWICYEHTIPTLKKNNPKNTQGHMIKNIMGFFRKSSSTNLEITKSSTSSKINNQNINYNQNINNNNEIQVENIIPIDWKKTYLTQYLANKKALSNCDSEKRKYETQKITTVAMFGEGLQTSAKKLIYRMMWDMESPLIVSGLFPGIEGLGSGVGFYLQNQIINLVALHRYEERGVFSQVRDSWKKFFNQVSGIVYVVDLHKDLLMAKKELDTFLSEVNPGPPLLILACSKSDLFDPKLKATALVEQLGLNHQTFEKRKWYIREIDLETLEGLYDAIFWLSEEINK